MRITKKHKVRQDIANLPTYHETIGKAVSAVCDVLEHHDMQAEIKPCGQEGSVNAIIKPLPAGGLVCDSCDCKINRAEFDNCVVFAWYTMLSGRIELVCYIS